MKYLQNDIEVRYFENGAEESALVKLVDYINVERNSFVIANQWTIIKEQNK